MQVKHQKRRRGQRTPDICRGSTPSIESCQFSSVAQSCPTLCDPMNRSIPGLPVHQVSRKFTQLMSIELVMSSSHHILCCPLLLLPPILEFTQTHVHRVGNAIQPSHPLLSPSPPAPNPSQYQGLFQMY